MKHRKPYKIQKEATQWLRKRLLSYGILSKFPVYVTDTVRGRCDYKNQNVTVPLWAIQDGRVKEGYDIYYACHELAHAMAPSTKGDVHGAKFQAAFMSICPEEYWHYELEYKPRLAAAAGITKKETYETHR